MVTETGPGPSTPRRFHGRYRLESKLAAGGMGTVYRAVDERLERRVAVKILRGDLAQEPRFVERFRREARSVAALAHPNIATVFDYGEDAGHHFIVMELAEGRDLARLLREHGPLSPDRSIRIAEQVCDALSHAHAAGVVHRDVKPANVIVGEQDLVKVTDFGIARVAGDSTLTATGSVLGSAHYISPEQANGAAVGPPSDVYSTGIVVYEMLTGAVPFTGDSPVSVAMRHLRDNVPAPSLLNRDVPAELDRVVATATAHAPEDRYPDAGVMGAALQACLTGAAPLVVGTRPVAVSDTAPLTDPAQSVWPIPGDRWDPQRLGRMVALVFGVLLAIAVGLLVFRLASDDGPRAGRDRRERGARGAAPRGSATNGPSPQPTVPSVVGLSYEDAEKLLIAAGFDVGRNDRPHPSVPEGDVIDAEPAPGSVAGAGETITLSVSSGSEGADEADGEDVDEDVPPGHGGVPPGQAKKDKKEKDKD
ncbi:MAG TPA: protein kinase [Actinomycetota bacterium]|jgi:serine/threonine-protein kinase